jgi:hypothetical protein
MFFNYFTNGTRGTQTGAKVGIEVETDFVTESGEAIPVCVTKQILASSDGRPLACEPQKLELGRQKIELAILPQTTAELAIEAARESLQWLYARARMFGAYPFFAPELSSSNDLLLVQEERDEVWVQLDGRQALEELCHCSSVQFTVDVNPDDAIGIINRLWARGLHEYDYAPNNRRWQAYIAKSLANYRPNRYAGPAGFNDLTDYVAQLCQHTLVMHNGSPCRQLPQEVIGLDSELYLRSIWWHYRLRRYSNTLALEMRPFARRADEQFTSIWGTIANTIGL